MHLDSQYLPTFSKKVCLLGGFAVGKTSLVRRFLFDRFDERYINTMGVQVNRKTMIVPSAEEFAEMIMLLWDTAGGNDLSRDHASYLRGAAGAILVCDCTRRYTLEQLEKQAAHFLDINSCARLILAVTKRDLINRRELRPDEVEKVADRLNAPHYFVSSKTGVDVDLLFRHLARLLVQ